MLDSSRTEVFAFVASLSELCGKVSPSAEREKLFRPAVPYSLTELFHKLYQQRYFCMSLLFFYLAFFRSHR
jgi:GDP-D-mannose dehydratase